MTKIYMDPALGGGKVNKARYKMRNFNAAKAVENGIARIGWLIVIGAALALSFYSLYFVGRHYGLPNGLAILVSLTFDGAAIACANLALKYARTGDSSLTPTLMVFLLAGASSFLNAQHAILIHAPKAAIILYCSPPIVAVLLFELYSRYERRTALKKAGKIAKAMPPLGKYAWLLFPFKSISLVRRITERRLEQFEPDNNQNGTTNNFLVLTDPRTVRAWAIQQGFNVGDRGRISGEIVQAYHAERAEIEAKSEPNLTLIDTNKSNTEMDA
jgi:Protein of unknown function (DUF2637)/Lsr2